MPKFHFYFTQLYIPLTFVIWLMYLYNDELQYQVTVFNERDRSQ